MAAPPYFCAPPTRFVAHHEFQRRPQWQTSLGRTALFRRTPHTFGPEGNSTEGPNGKLRRQSHPNS
eukprot:6311380-Pyramimonas_sp.AAC.1